MAEEGQTPEAGAEQPKPRFEALKVYVKDVSFEAPATPEIFLQQNSKPEVGVEVEIDYKSVDDAQGLIEVVLEITVTSKIGDTVMYLVEVHQAGIFQIIHPRPEARRFTVEVTAPHILLPFAREALNSLITKGGFNSFLITPVNFEVIYKDKLAQEEKLANEANSQPPESVN